MTWRPYVTDISLAGMPARTPSMLLDTIRVGPNTYMGVSRACDEAMAALSSVSRAFLDPFQRGVTFLATEVLDELLANKANQQYHFKSSRCGMDPLGHHKSYCGLLCLNQCSCTYIHAVFSDFRGGLGSTKYL